MLYGGAVFLVLAYWRLRRAGVPAMIALRNLSLENGEFYLSDLSLEVAGGEIYFLLNRLDQDNDLLFQGLERLPAGRPAGRSFSTASARQAKRRRAVFIDRIADMADFETEARVGDWIDFLCATGLSRENIYQNPPGLQFP